MLSPKVHVKADKLMFFVEESRAAEQLKELRSIQSRHGELPIAVKPSPPPRGEGGSGSGGGGSSGVGGVGGGGEGGPPWRKEGFSGRRMQQRGEGDVTMEEDSAAVLLVSATVCLCSVTCYSMSLPPHLTSSSSSSSSFSFSPFFCSKCWESDLTPQTKAWT